LEFTQDARLGSETHLGEDIVNGLGEIVVLPKAVSPVIELAGTVRDRSQDACEDGLIGQRAVFSSQAACLQCNPVARKEWIELIE